MILRFATLFCLILLALTGCEEIRFPEEIKTFPMDIGSEWTYERKVFICYFESDSSDVIVDRDTLIEKIRLFIEKDTVLNDTARVKVFVTEREEYGQVSKSYMYMDGDGLRCYGYKNPGLGVNLKKGATNPAMPFHIYGILTSVVPPLNDDDIFLEKPPTLNLKLPMREGTLWTYRAKNWQIDKKVYRREVMKAGNEKYQCFIIRWIYFDEMLDGLEIRDWIAEEGLIKKETSGPRVVLTNPDGTVEGYVGMREVIKLTGLDLR